MFTTIGRKSGKERTHALLYLKVGGNWVVTGSNGGAQSHPDWYFNLIAQPVAKVQVGKYSANVKPRIAVDQEREELWKKFLEVWPGYATYQQGIDRQIPVIVLAPVRETFNIDQVSNSIPSINDPVVVKSPPANSVVPRGEMFIPIHRKTIWRDLAVIQVGYALFGLSIAVMIRANLGQVPGLSLKWLYPKSCISRRGH